MSEIFINFIYEHLYITLILLNIFLLICTVILDSVFTNIYIYYLKK